MTSSLYPQEARNGSGIDRCADIVATTAGVEMSGFPVCEVNVRGRAESLTVRIVGAMNELVV